MTQTVTALYDIYEDADAATRALEEAGIPGFRHQHRLE